MVFNNVILFSIIFFFVFNFFIYFNKINIFLENRKKVYNLLMHLSLKTPTPTTTNPGETWAYSTWGFVSASMSYQPPGGGGIVHFRHFGLQYYMVLYQLLKWIADG